MNYDPRSTGDERYAPGVQRVSQRTFMTVLWTFTATSAVFLIARLGIRIKAFRRLASDDFLAISAWLMLLAYSITWQIKVPIMYWQFRVVQDGQPATEDFLHSWSHFMPFVAMWEILFYCCLWSVKFSFLMFFRQLEQKSGGRRIWWWFVFFVTIAGLAACLGDIPYECSEGPFIHIMTACAEGKSIRYSVNTLYGNMVADVVTDVLILSIPILVLWNVQLSRRRKAILYVVFSATVVVIIISFVRAIISAPHPSVKRNVSIDWIFLWKAIQMGISIMIACGASFRQLFVAKGSQAFQSSSKTSMSLRNLISHLGLGTRASKMRTNSEQSDWDDDIHISPPQVGQLNDQAGMNTTGSVRVQSTVEVFSEPLSAKMKTSRPEYRSWNPVDHRP